MKALQLAHEQMAKVLSLQKNNILKSICLNCGLARSGTKPILVNRIANSLARSSLPINSINSNNSVSKSKHQKETFKLLSIDLGIKNFSYCKFVLPRDPSIEKPEVYEWSKVNVFNHWGVSDDVSPEFSVDTFCKIAFLIVNELILNDTFTEPFDMILIEEQRARTAGSSAVQEWTLRVNMLEHMLFSTIYTLQQNCYPGLQDTMVFSSNPKRMSDFWMNYETFTAEEVKPQKSLSRKAVETENNIKKKPRLNNAMIKAQRIKLIKSWVELVLVSDSLSVPFVFHKKLHHQLQNSYKKQQKEVKKKKKNSLFDIIMTTGNSEKGKSDDLADSLLHGISWFSWMKNQKVLKNALILGETELLKNLTLIEKEHIKEMTIK